uniref:Uncharacterized protein n=1 Tax=Rousettus aegyptiacus TaxID=9407 RepID=A0A7J8HR97_ROUAE|nr:hypothetical protein HJG63_010961 [Rousettus aegyptiacus]
MLSFQPAPRALCNITPSLPGGFAELDLSTPCMHWFCSAWPSAPLPKAVAAPVQPVCLSSPPVPLCSISLWLIISCHPGQIQEPAFLAHVCLLSQLHLGTRAVASLLLLEARGSFSHISKPPYPAQLCPLEAWLCVMGLVPFMTGIYVEVQPLQSKVQK